MTPRDSPHSITSQLTGVSVSWVSEGAASVESNPTFANSKTDAEKMLAHSIMSNELLEDEEVGLADYLVAIFGEAMGAEIDAQAFDGSGSPFTGVLNTVGVNNVDMPATKTAFTDLDWSDLNDADSLLRASVRNGARWYLHRTILGILRGINDSQNRPIWTPPAGDTPATLWDSPYSLVEQMPAKADTAVSTPFIFIGNMKNYAIGTKGGMTVAVDKSIRLLNDETIMVFRRRIAMVAALPKAFTTITTAAA